MSSFFNPDPDPDDHDPDPDIEADADPNLNPYPQSKIQAGLSLGPMILIFGCRRESMDLLRKETDKFGLVRLPLPC